MPALRPVWRLQAATHGRRRASCRQATNVRSRFVAYRQSKACQHAAAAVWPNLGLSPQGALEREICG